MSRWKYLDTPFMSMFMRDPDVATNIFLFGNGLVDLADSHLSDPVEAVISDAVGDHVRGLISDTVKRRPQ